MRIMRIMQHKSYFIYTAVLFIIHFTNLGCCNSALSGENVQHGNKDFHKRKKGTDMLPNKQNISKKVKTKKMGINDRSLSNEIDIIGIPNLYTLDLQNQKTKNYSRVDQPIDVKKGKDKRSLLENENLHNLYNASDVNGMIIYKVVKDQQHKNHIGTLGDENNESAVLSTDQNISHFIHNKSFMNKKNQFVQSINLPKSNETPLILDLDIKTIRQNIPFVKIKGNKISSILSHLRNKTEFLSTPFGRPMKRFTSSQTYLKNVKIGLPKSRRKRIKMVMTRNRKSFIEEPKDDVIRPKMQNYFESVKPNFSSTLLRTKLLNLSDFQKKTLAVRENMKHLGIDKLGLDKKLIMNLDNDATTLYKKSNHHFYSKISFPKAMVLQSIRKQRNRSTKRTKVTYAYDKRDKYSSGFFKGTSDSSSGENESGDDSLSSDYLSISGIEQSGQFELPKNSLNMRKMPYNLRKDTDTSTHNISRLVATTWLSHKKEKQQQQQVTQEKLSLGEFIDSKLAILKKSVPTLPNHYKKDYQICCYYKDNDNAKLMDKNCCKKSETDGYYSQCCHQDYNNHQYYPPTVTSETHILWGDVVPNVKQPTSFYNISSSLSYDIMTNAPVQSYPVYETGSSNFEKTKATNKETHKVKMKANSHNTSLNAEDTVLSKSDSSNDIFWGSIPLLKTTPLPHASSVYHTKLIDRLDSKEKTKSSNRVVQENIIPSRLASYNTKNTSFDQNRKLPKSTDVISISQHPLQVDSRIGNEENATNTILGNEKQTNSSSSEQINLRLNEFNDSMQPKLSIGDRKKITDSFEQNIDDGSTERLNGQGSGDSTKTNNVGNDNNNIQLNSTNLMNEHKHGKNLQTAINLQETNIFGGKSIAKNKLRKTSMGDARKSSEYNRDESVEKNIHYKSKTDNKHLFSNDIHVLNGNKDRVQQHDIAKVVLVDKDNNTKSKSKFRNSLTFEISNLKLPIISETQTKYENMSQYQPSERPLDLPKTFPALADKLSTKGKGSKNKKKAELNSNSRVISVLIDKKENEQVINDDSDKEVKRNNKHSNKTSSSTYHIDDEEINPNSLALKIMEGKKKKISRKFKKKKNMAQLVDQKISTRIKPQQSSKTGLIENGQSTNKPNQTKINLKIKNTDQNYVDQEIKNYTYVIQKTYKNNTLNKSPSENTPAKDQPSKKVNEDVKDSNLNGVKSIFNVNIVYNETLEEPKTSNVVSNVSSIINKTRKKIELENTTFQNSSRNKKYKEIERNKMVVEETTVEDEKKKTAQLSEGMEPISLEITINRLKGEKKGKLHMVHISKPNKTYFHIDEAKTKKENNNELLGVANETNNSDNRNKTNPNKDSEEKGSFQILQINKKPSGNLTITNFNVNTPNKLKFQILKNKTLNVTSQAESGIPIETIDGRKINIYSLSIDQETFDYQNVSVSSSNKITPKINQQNISNHGKIDYDELDSAHLPISVNGQNKDRDKPTQGLTPESLPLIIFNQNDENRNREIKQVTEKMKYLSSPHLGKKLRKKIKNKRPATTIAITSDTSDTDNGYYLNIQIHSTQKPTNRYKSTKESKQKVTKKKISSKKQTNKKLRVSSTKIKKKINHKKSKPRNNSRATSNKKEVSYHSKHKDDGTNDYGAKEEKALTTENPSFLTKEEDNNSTETNFNYTYNYLTKTTFSPSKLNNVYYRMNGTNLPYYQYRYKETSQMQDIEYQTKLPLYQNKPLPTSISYSNESNQNEINASTDHIASRSSNPTVHPVLEQTKSPNGNILATGNHIIYPPTFKMIQHIHNIESLPGSQYKTTAPLYNSDYSNIICLPPRWPCASYNNVYLYPTQVGYPYPPSMSTSNSPCVSMNNRPCFSLIPCIPYPGYSCPVQVPNAALPSHTDFVGTQANLFETTIRPISTRTYSSTTMSPSINMQKKTNHQKAASLIPSFKDKTSTLADTSYNIIPGSIPIETFPPIKYIDNITTPTVSSTKIYSVKPSNSTMPQRSSKNISSRTPMHKITPGSIPVETFPSVKDESDTKSTNQLSNIFATAEFSPTVGLNTVGKTKTTLSANSTVSSRMEKGQNNFETKEILTISQAFNKNKTNTGQNYSRTTPGPIQIETFPFREISTLSPGNHSSFETTAMYSISMLRKNSTPVLTTTVDSTPVPNHDMVLPTLNYTQNNNMPESNLSSNNDGRNNNTFKSLLIPVNHQDKYHDRLYGKSNGNEVKNILYQTTTPGPISVMTFPEHAMGATLISKGETLDINQYNGFHGNKDKPLFSSSQVMTEIKEDMTSSPANYSDIIDSGFKIPESLSNYYQYLNNYYATMHGWNNPTSNTPTAAIYPINKTDVYSSVSMSQMMSTTITPNDSKNLYTLPNTYNEITYQKTSFNKATYRPTVNTYTMNEKKTNDTLLKIFHGDSNKKSKYIDEDGTGRHEVLDMNNPSNIPSPGFHTVPYSPTPQVLATGSMHDEEIQETLEQKQRESNNNKTHWLFHLNPIALPPAYSEYISQKQINDENLNIYGLGSLKEELPPEVITAPESVYNQISKNSPLINITGHNYDSMASFLPVRFQRKSNDLFETFDSFKTNSSTATFSTINQTFSKPLIASSLMSANESSNKNSNYSTGDKFNQQYNISNRAYVNPLSNDKKGNFSLISTSIPTSKTTTNTVSRIYQDMYPETTKMPEPSSKLKSQQIHKITSSNPTQSQQDSFATSYNDYINDYYQKVINGTGNPFVLLDKKYSTLPPQSTIFRVKLNKLSFSYPFPTQHVTQVSLVTNANESLVMLQNQSKPNPYNYLHVAQITNPTYVPKTNNLATVTKFRVTIPNMKEDEVKNESNSVNHGIFSNEEDTSLPVPKYKQKKKNPIQLTTPQTNEGVNGYNPSSYHDTYQSTQQSNTFAIQSALQQDTSPQYKVEKQSFTYLNKSDNSHTPTPIPKTAMNSKPYTFATRQTSLGQYEIPRPVSLTSEAYPPQLNESDYEKYLATYFKSLAALYKTTIRTPSTATSPSTPNTMPMTTINQSEVSEEFFFNSPRNNNNEHSIKTRKDMLHRQSISSAVRIYNNSVEGDQVSPVKNVPSSKMFNGFSSYDEYITDFYTKLTKYPFVKNIGFEQERRDGIGKIKKEVLLKNLHPSFSPTFKVNKRLKAPITKLSVIEREVPIPTKRFLDDEFGQKQVKSKLEKLLVERNRKNISPPLSLKDSINSYNRYIDDYYNKIRFFHGFSSYDAYLQDYYDNLSTEYSDSEKVQNAQRTLTDNNFGNELSITGNYITNTNSIKKDTLMHPSHYPVRSGLDLQTRTLTQRESFVPNKLDSYFKNTNEEISRNKKRRWKNMEKLRVYGFQPYDIYLSNFYKAMELLKTRSKITNPIIHSRHEKVENDNYKETYYKVAVESMYGFQPYEKYMENYYKIEAINQNQQLDKSQNDNRSQKPKSSLELDTNLKNTESNRYNKNSDFLDNKRPTSKRDSMSINENEVNILARQLYPVATKKDIIPTPAAQKVQINANTSGEVANESNKGSYKESNDSEFDESNSKSSKEYAVGYSSYNEYMKHFYNSLGAVYDKKESNIESSVKEVSLTTANPISTVPDVGDERKETSILQNSSSILNNGVKSVSQLLDTKVEIIPFVTETKLVQKNNLIEPSSFVNSTEEPLYSNETFDNLQSPYTPRYLTLSELLDTNAEKNHHKSYETQSLSSATNVSAESADPLSKEKEERPNIIETSSTEENDSNNVSDFFAKYGKYMADYYKTVYLWSLDREKKKEISKDVPLIDDDITSYKEYLLDYFKEINILENESQDHVDNKTSISKYLTTPRSSFSKQSSIAILKTSSAETSLSEDKVTTRQIIPENPALLEHDSKYDPNFEISVKESPTSTLKTTRNIDISIPLDRFQVKENNMSFSQVTQMHFKTFRNISLTDNKELGFTTKPSVTLSSPVNQPKITFTTEKNTAIDVDTSKPPVPVFSSHEPTYLDFQDLINQSSIVTHANDRSTPLKSVDYFYYDTLLNWRRYNEEIQNWVDKYMVPIMKRKINVHPDINPTVFPGNDSYESIYEDYLKNIEKWEAENYYMLKTMANDVSIDRRLSSVSKFAISQTTPSMSYPIVPEKYTNDIYKLTDYQLNENNIENKIALPTTPIKNDATSVLPVQTSSNNTWHVLPEANSNITVILTDFPKSTLNPSLSKLEFPNINELRLDNNNSKSPTDILLNVDKIISKANEIVPQLNVDRNDESNNIDDSFKFDELEIIDATEKTPSVKNESDTNTTTQTSDLEESIPNPSVKDLTFSDSTSRAIQYKQILLSSNKSSNSTNQRFLIGKGKEVLEKENKVTSEIPPDLKSLINPYTNIVTENELYKPTTSQVNPISSVQKIEYTNDKDTFSDFGDETKYFSTSIPIQNASIPTKNIVEPPTYLPLRYQQLSKTVGVKNAIDAVSSNYKNNFDEKNQSKLLYGNTISQHYLNEDKDQTRDRQSTNSNQMSSFSATPSLYKAPSFFATLRYKTGFVVSQEKKEEEISKSDEPSANPLKLSSSSKTWRNQSQDFNDEISNDSLNNKKDYPENHYKDENDSDLSDVGSGDEVNNKIVKLVKDDDLESHEQNVMKNENFTLKVPNNLSATSTPSPIRQGTFLESDLIPITDMQRRSPVEVGITTMPSLKADFKTLSILDKIIKQEMIQQMSDDISILHNEKASLLDYPTQKGNVTEGNGGTYNIETKPSEEHQLTTSKAPKTTNLYESATENFLSLLRKKSVLTPMKEVPSTVVIENPFTQRYVSEFHPMTVNPVIKAIAKQLAVNEVLTNRDIVIGKSELPYNYENDSDDLKSVSNIGIASNNDFQTDKTKIGRLLDEKATFEIKDDESRESKRSEIPDALFSGSGFEKTDELDDEDLMTSQFVLTTPTTVSNVR